MRFALPALALVILGILTAIGPLSMHMFLPALPIVQTYFGVSTAVTQLTLSLPQLLLTPAMLIYGPFSDRYGRRPILFLGLTIYLLGTLTCVIAPAMAILIGGRVFQQIGVSAGQVVGRAIIRDLYPPEEVASKTATMLLVLLVGPALAPTIGGHFVEWFGWRSVFVFLAAFGVVAAFLVYRWMPESNVNRGGELSFRHIHRDFLALVRMPKFTGYTLNMSMSFSVWIAFISFAPYLTRAMGVDPSEYGNWFIISAAGYGTGTVMCSRLSKRLGINRMVIIGNLTGLAAILTCIAIAAAGALTMLSLFCCMAVVGVGMGLSMPNASAGAINCAPRMAGTAASVMGFVQMALIAGAMQVTGFLDPESPYPILVTMLLGALAGLASLRLVLRTPRAAPATV